MGSGVEPVPGLAAIRVRALAKDTQSDTARQDLHTKGGGSLVAGFSLWPHVES